MSSQNSANSPFTHSPLQGGWFSSTSSFLVIFSVVVFGLVVVFVTILVV
jgi:hypothetical protein